MKETKEFTGNFKVYKFTSSYTNDVKKDKIRKQAHESYLIIML